MADSRDSASRNARSTRLRSVTSVMAATYPTTRPSASNSGS